jgi:hypothetical protein
MIMLRIWISAIATIAALTACAPMATQPQSAAAPRIEATPGKAVVFIVRTRPDLSYLATPLIVDDQMIGASYAGTYFRLELPPGRHRISGYGQDNGAMTFDVQPDRVYFIQHTVSGSWRATNPHSFFSVMNEGRARAAMARAVPAAG